MKRQFLVFGLATVSALTLGATAMALVLALVLHDEVGTLEQRARKAARQAQALQTELAALRSDLQAATRAEAPVDAVAQIEAISPPAAEETVAPRAAPVRVATARAGFVRVGSSPSECVYHPGNPGGLMECIQRAESARPARSGYR